MIKRLAILVVISVMASIFSACSSPDSVLNKGNDADYSLYNGIIHGNSQVVTEAISKGGNKNQLPWNMGENTDHGTFEHNPFRIACFIAKDNVAQALIEDGADPNAKDAEGYPILAYAGRSANLGLCKLLLDHGANVNESGANGYTPMDAIFLDIGNTRRNNFIISQVVDLFISKGAKMTPKTVEAMMKGHKDGYRNYLLDQKVLKMLLSSGQKSGLSPALEAAMLGKTDQVRTYLESNQVTKADLQDVLFYTAAFGDSKTLQLSVQKGQSLKSTDDLDNTLLAIASKTGNLETMQFLIEKGADMNAQNGDYYTPLRLAVADDQFKAAQLLLEKGAKMLPELSWNGPDVLWNASSNGNVEMMKLLFQNGYPKNNDTVSLAMQSAAGNNQIGSLKYLLSLGFGPNPEYSDSDQTPLEQACQFGSMESLQLLVEHGASPDGGSLKGNPLYIASLMGQTEIVRYLIEKGAKINIMPTYIDNSHADTPLVAAIQSGSFAIVKLLVEHGADINDQDSDENPVIQTTGFGSNDILKYLLQNGAKVNSQNGDGNTPLIIAAISGDIENVETLLGYHADKGIKNKRGYTALTITKSKNGNEINRILQAIK